MTLYDAISNWILMTLMMPHNHYRAKHIQCTSCCVYFHNFPDILLIIYHSFDSWSFIFHAAFGSFLMKTLHNLSD